MKKKKRKYSIVRILRVLGVAGIMVLLFFSIQLKSNTNIKNVNIVLKSKLQSKLIAKTDILKYLNKSLDKDLEIEIIDRVEIDKIERLLDNSKYIKRSDVYLDSKNHLHIECELRDPIVRISRKTGKDFYLDSEGSAIPISKRRTVRVPIINGNIGIAGLSDINKEGSKYNDILKLSKKINSDPFLKPLIEQIYIDNSNRLTLIPKLGRQKIEFGELVGIDEKLRKIKAFYKSGLPTSGWDKFEKLNLEWEGQVVITKSN